MKTTKEQERLLEISTRFHRERIFLNNPIVMQGMGLAPLVIVATTGMNAMMLAVAVALMLTPTRVLASILLRNVRNMLLRAVCYATIAAAVYVPVYFVLERLFGTQMLVLGIYLPMLVVEPLLIYRFGRVAEPTMKALRKGIRNTVGYAIVLMLIGCLREFFAFGTLFSYGVITQQMLPLAALPAGGFILIGIVCAIWRALVNYYRKHLTMEAKGQR